MTQNEDRPPLESMLSKALVALTIEFDNEAEHRLPHRTTNHGRTPGAIHAPWLVSMVMWTNCMRFIRTEGIRVGALEPIASVLTPSMGSASRWKP